MALLLATGCAATGADEQQRSASQNGYVGGSQSLTRVPPEDRSVAPVAAGRELGRSTSLSTGEYRGKVVVLNVWASWGVP